MIERERLDTILNLYQQIQSHWAKKNRFEYVVVPSGDICEKPLEEMKLLTFNVGITGAQLSALFLLVTDQAAQMRKAAATRSAGDAPQTEASYSSVVNLAPTDEQILSVLEQIQFTVYRDEEEPMLGEQGEQGKTIGDFGLTSDRVNYILAMVKKKADVAMSRTHGNHFKVYPPPEFLQHPNVATGTDIYGKLKDTVWWVRWYDGQYDQLRFIEFLTFIEQIIATKFAFEQAAKAAEKHSASRRSSGSKHAGGWQPKKDPNRRPKPKPDTDTETLQVKVEGCRIEPAKTAKDDMIRVLFSKVILESTPRPNQALN